MSDIENNYPYNNRGEIIKCDPNHRNFTDDELWRKCAGCENLWVDGKGDWYCVLIGEVEE